MPHQCVHCSKIINAGSREILEGCSSCGGKFFFYIKDEQAEKLREEQKIPLKDFDKTESKRIEEEVRSILKIEDLEKPVILDLESVRVIDKGKFEIDIVSLMNRRPIVFKLQEGKYLIDLGEM